MRQYLTEVVGRLSTGGLIAMLALLVVCIIISSIRGNRAKAKPVTKAMACPLCGSSKEVKS